MDIATTVGFDIRDLPGYDFLSEVGGSVITAITAGAISKEDQSKLMDLAHKAAGAYGKPVGEISKADLDRYINEYGAQGKTPTWVIPAIALGGAIILFGIFRRK